MIVSILILLFSIGALAQFSIAYCHTLLIAYGKVEVSNRTQKLIDINIQEVDPMAFGRLMQLVRMAPDPGDDSAEIRIIHAYFHVMSLVRVVLSPISKYVARWTYGELSRCAYFAAVTFDRRMSPLQNL